MTIYFNWPDQTLSGSTNPSREAGAAVGQALAAVMGILQAFETRSETLFFERRGTANEQLAKASRIFDALKSSGPPAKVTLPIRLRGAWGAADGFLAALGEAVGRELVRPVVSVDVSVQDLMAIAATLINRLGHTLGDLKPDFEDSAAGRRVAADAVALQMFGILVAQLLAEKGAATA
jgi:hypothetical protein